MLGRAMRQDQGLFREPLLSATNLKGVSNLGECLPQPAFTAIAAWGLHRPKEDLKYGSLPSFPLDYTT